MNDMHNLTLPFPDDWHLHLRDDDYLARTVADSAQRFKRAIVMPNLKTPITSVAQARDYRARILQHVPQKKIFNPLMTLYLTEDLSKNTIIEAKKSGIIFGCKLYPGNVTTHSQAGVKNFEKIYPILEQMEKENLPLLIHGETPDPEVDVFDREKKFLETILANLIQRFSHLRMVLEHISTTDAVDFVKLGPVNLAATITPHHLLLNRNHLLSGGIHPHYYCAPIVKRKKDQEAVIKAATSGHAKFFLGTDSAPHAKSKKETDCGCAGIYSAHAAIELYVEIFERENALNQLAQFTSINGAQFYQLPINTEILKLKKESWHIPHTLSFGNEELVPLWAGQEISWRIDD